MKRYFALAFVLCLVCACGGSNPIVRPTRTPYPTITAIPYDAKATRTPAPATYVMLDGKESDGTLTVPAINVWKDYDNRASGIVGTGKHGQRVKLIRRVGDAVQIELPDGAQGWVTYYFIKEYK